MAFIGEHFGRHSGGLQTASPLRKHALMSRVFRVAALVLLFPALTCLGQSSDHGVQPQPQRGPVAALKRVWSGAVGGVETVANLLTRPFSFLSERKAPPKSRKIPGLSLSVVLEPDPASLSRDRQIQAHLTLSNQSKRTQLLVFRTTQRVDAVLRDESGRIVGRASEDREYAEEAAVVAVNPGEKLHFDLGLPTRQIVAGKKYTLEAGLVDQEGLTVRRVVSIRP